MGEIDSSMIWDRFAIVLVNFTNLLFFLYVYIYGYKNITITQV